MTGQFRTSLLEFLPAKTLLLPNEQRGLHSRRYSRAHTIILVDATVTRSLGGRATFIINANGTICQENCILHIKIIIEKKA